ncbi:hypothetical protein OG496_37405 [Streptomyces sp. NBC_00988]|uniref:hypothetical protein n=1 Tax=Streptomyces sp. NBC_00988 TaxID=2903704 RepID=UPI00386AB699|nr:hypothetical protein OG496_37405 [Streptomyces sp. NBC_00988]
MPAAEDTPEVPELDAAPLSKWERLGASLSGTALSGAGVAAVFVTSNQAGSVALLLVGVVLLIMGINGSPLTRARYQDYELFMTRRRRQIAASIEQESPEDARQALQVLTTVDPGASRDPFVAHVSAAVLEREVIERLVRQYPTTSFTGGPGDMGLDAVVPTPNGTIGVQVKGGSAPLSGLELRRMVLDASSARIPPAPAGVDALLVVTNKPLPTDLPRRVREVSSTLPTAVVRWVDEQDDQVLDTKIQELTRRISSPE